MPGEEEVRSGLSAQLATTALTTTTTTNSGSGGASSSSSSTTSSSSAVPKVALPVLALRGSAPGVGLGLGGHTTTSGGGSSTPTTTTIPPILASCPTTTVNNNILATTPTSAGVGLSSNINSAGLHPAGGGGALDVGLFNNNGSNGKKPTQQSFQTPNPLPGTRPSLLTNTNAASAAAAAAAGLVSNYNNNKQQHLHQISPQFSHPPHSLPALSSQLSLKPIIPITTPNGNSSSPSVAETKRDTGGCNGHTGGGAGHHAGGVLIDDDEIESAGDSSKLELAQQFAGIDNETVDVDVEDEESNFEAGIESGPMCTVVPTSKSNGNGSVGGGSSGGGGGPDKSAHPSFAGDVPGGGSGTMVVASSAAAAGSAAPTSTTSSTVGATGGPTGDGHLGATTPRGVGGSTLGEDEEEDVEGGKTVECTEVVVPDQSFAEKCLFYTTAFFILLAVFSLFAFLFLVPFVIDPAFTTIFMEFDPEPAFCETVSVEQREGLSNCSWTSCREGCTREVYQCKQIRVNYRSARKSHSDDFQRRPNTNNNNNNNNHNLNLANNNLYNNHGGSSSSLASSDLRSSEHSGSSVYSPFIQYNYNNLISSSSSSNANGGVAGAGPASGLGPYHSALTSASAAGGAPGIANIANLRDAAPSSKLSKSHFKNLNSVHHSNKYAVHSAGGAEGGGGGAELSAALLSHNSASSRSSGGAGGGGVMNLKASKHNRVSQQLRSANIQTHASPSGNGGKEPLWDFELAHLFPNVKGCGYPPVIVCSDFIEKYGKKGTNFTCYYSKVDRALVVTQYDMSRVIMDLVYSMAIPIPSFIISVVYLIFAYFRIYNTDSSSTTHETGGGGRAQRLNSSSTTTNLQNPGSANQGGGGSSADDPDAETSISVDDKTCIIQRSTSRGLNALSDKLPNSGKGLHAQVIEMNDLNPQLRHPVDGDVFLPKRNNNCNPPPPHERNGPTNPAAKNKGEEMTPETSTTPTVEAI